MLVLLIFLFISKVVVEANHGTSQFHAKLYNDSYHEKPWMALKEVDGLKNDDVVMLISSSQVRSFSYLRGSLADETCRIIPSYRTWLKLFAHAFVIIEDTFGARFAMRHCTIRETVHFTSFDCHNEPTYILSRKCLPTKGGGPGPCCKVDELFTYLIVDRPDVYSHVKYALHCDDDTYFRTDQVLRWLAKIEKSGVSPIPIVASPNPNDPKEHIYSVQECEEVHTNGWYQPFMLNKASMERVKEGFKAYGTMWTCNNFKITHDVGMGPFFWMYGLYHIGLPDTYVGNHGTAIANMITHSVKHGGIRDNCDNITNYSETQLHTQKIVVGCGSIDEPQMNHVKGEKDYNGRDDLYNDMYDLWNHFKDNGRDINLNGAWSMQDAVLYPSGDGSGDVRLVKHILEEWEFPESDGTFQGLKVEQLMLPQLLQLRGYNTTKHSQQYDIVKEWKNFTMSDCVVEGYKGTKKKPKPGESV